MAFLTKEECVRRHRLLWNYIADEILEQEKVPWNYKEEAFEHFGWHNGVIFNYCWACYYCKMKDFEMIDTENTNRWINCHNCLFDWHGRGDESWDEEYSNACDEGTALYSRFYELKTTNGDWKETARLAREIANMPVRENV